MLQYEASVPFSGYLTRAFSAARNVLGSNGSRLNNQVTERVCTILLTVLCVSCAAVRPTVRTPVDGIYSVVNQYVFPADTSPEFEQSIRRSSKVEVRTFDRYGRFVIVYADVRNDAYPRGIRSVSGGNGPNFVFRLEDRQAVLVYHNGDAVENRIELAETEKGLFLYSYAHIGLSSGPPERIRYRWNGTKFVYLD